MLIKSISSIIHVSRPIFLIPLFHDCIIICIIHNYFCITRHSETLIRSFTNTKSFEKIRLVEAVRGLKRVFASMEWDQLRAIAQDMVVAAFGAEQRVIKEL